LFKNFTLALTDSFPSNMVESLVAETQAHVFKFLFQKVLARSARPLRGSRIMQADGGSKVTKRPLVCQIA